MASPLRPDPPEHHRPSHAADFARGDSLDRPVGRLPGPHQRWGTRRANPLAGLAPTGGCGWDVALVASGFLCVYLWVMISRDKGRMWSREGALCLSWWQRDPFGDFVEQTGRTPTRTSTRPPHPLHPAPCPYRTRAGIFYHSPIRLSQFIRMVTCT